MIRQTADRIRLRSQKGPRASAGQGRQTKTGNRQAADIGLALAAVLVVAASAAGQPRLANARVTEQAVTHTLSETVNRLTTASTETTWIAYAMPVENGSSSMCCWSGGFDSAGRGNDACCGTCKLEPGSGTTFRSNDSTHLATRLEPRDTFFVFYRVENKRIERIRIFSEDCGLDAGNAAVVWLTGVKPAESISFLSTLALSSDATDRRMKGAVSAIAQHAGNDAVTPLVRLGREAPDTKVRSEALFWLSQRAGARAMAAITDAIEHDPETQVKRQAVFALSQLPAGEGVPKLIEVARTNANPAVRKQAMFWLGQSKDPRALSFFEQILKQ
jgi:hypothetical protein